MIINNNKSPELNPTKFTLYNYEGKAKSYYLVERKKLENQETITIKPVVAHSIIIIDRSASMYYEIQRLKEYLIKLLTLDEYSNSQLIITLISYSSQGNVKCHFQRIPISEIMKSDSKYQREINNIRVTGLTCISQSLEIAKTLIREFYEENNEQEVTAITLHSDGFANEPNYNSEVKKIEAICEEIKEFNAFINTISYSSSADFKLLAKIANSCSGKCLQANNIKQVYDSLYQTTKLLSKKVNEKVEEKLTKDYHYQIFVSKNTQKIIGSSDSLKVVGLNSDDDGIFYKYCQITEKKYRKLEDVKVAQTDESVFAFIRANLAEGKINTAKYGLISTLDYTLIKNHAKALTNTEIMNFTLDIEKAIFEPSCLKNHQILDKVKINKKITILELISLLEEHKNSIIINLKHLEKNYNRRGIKRIKGERDDEGNLIKLSLRTELIDNGEYVQMGKFNINRNTATINMLLTRKVKLLTTENKQQISEVAGILVSDLTQYNNYTIVSDGDINIPTLKVKINNRKTFDLLKRKGVLESEEYSLDKFNFRAEYDIRLDNLPLVPFNQNYANLNGIFEELIHLQVLSSIFSAHLKEESSFYSQEQLLELKKHYISKSLYLNFPTTNPYQNLEEALDSGEIDTRISYKIDLGNTEILNLSKLYSANKFLNRIYEGYDEKTGEKIEKLDFSLTLNQAITFGHKNLSKRVKLTKVDYLMQKIFDNFLGLNNNGTVINILNKINAHHLSFLLPVKWKEKLVDKEEFVMALIDAKNKLDNYIKKLYHQKICPLVFYIGSTGLIPDELKAKGITAEELSANYPNLKLSKNEQDGRFFMVNNTVISIYPKNEYYTPNKK